MLVVYSLMELNQVNMRDWESRWDKEAGQHARCAYIGYHDPLLATQAWEHVGWAHAGMDRAPTTHPQGRKTACDSEDNE